MEEGKDISGCSGKLHVQDDEASNVDKCAAAVKVRPDCSNRFFYAPLDGWCKCEEIESACTRTDSNYYNEYRITGASIIYAIASYTKRVLTFKLFLKIS